MKNVSFISGKKLNKPFGQPNIYDQVETFFQILIYLFLERKGRRERGRETSMWGRTIGQLPPIQPLTGDQAHKQGRCPDWQWNLRPLALWDNNQATKPHQSGQVEILKTF